MKDIKGCVMVRTGGSQWAGGNSVEEGLLLWRDWAPAQLPPHGVHPRTL